MQKKQRYFHIHWNTPLPNRNWRIQTTSQKSFHWRKKMSHRPPSNLRRLTCWAIQRTCKEKLLISRFYRKTTLHDFFFGPIALMMMLQIVSKVLLWIFLISLSLLILLSVLFFSVTCLPFLYVQLTLHDCSTFRFKNNPYNRVSMSIVENQIPKIRHSKYVASLLRNTFPPFAGVLSNLDFKLCLKQNTHTHTRLPQRLLLIRQI